MHYSDSRVLLEVMQTLTLKPVNARKVAFNACLVNNSHSTITIGARKFLYYHFTHHKIGANF